MPKIPKRVGAKKKFYKMKKNLLFCIAAFVMVALPMNAKKATKEYQRPSLHMVLMTTNTAATAEKAQIADSVVLGYASASWDSYTMPALYNDFRVPFTQTEVGAVKGSIMDILAQYNSPESLNGLGIGELKNIIEMLQGKKYREDLRAEVAKIENEVAHQLVAKWWSIQPDGTCSDTLLRRLACMSATQNQVADAAQTTLKSAGLYTELAEPTMANTYVTFTKLDFYENEPIAAFTRNIMLLIAGMAGIPGADLAAQKTYEAMKEGYTAFANCLLYKLEWNDEIAREFENTVVWDKTGRPIKIDMEKFNAMNFTLKYVGATGSSATCMMKKGDKGKGAEHMVNKTIYKALNRQFADLQREYEEFRPMVPVMGIDAKGGIIADMGTKEGVKVGDKFDVLEPVTNAKGVTKYEVRGTVKVVKWKGDEEQFKDGVWDNAEIDNDQEAGTADGSGDAVGTHLSKFKNATPSMFVKRAKK